MTTQLECDEKYANVGLCIGDFYYLFNHTRTYLTGVPEEYLNKIKYFSDPILRHYALYLYHNYKDAQKYFNKTLSNRENTACDNLNRWIDQRKSFFTHAAKCEENLKLWKRDMDPLWKLVQTLLPGNQCERNEIFSATSEFPKSLIPPVCYKHVPEHFICVNPPRERIPRPQSSPSHPKQPTEVKAAVPAKCPTLDTSQSISQAVMDFVCEECPSTTPVIAFTTFSTMFGTFILLFFLYKFTPLIPWLYRRRVNGSIPGRHIIEETYEEFEQASQSTSANYQNRRNYLHYQS
ncbi:PIR Superfamily Protein [Plasmodium ovale curtisi]|uniref:PIR Superfamily Protein n=1 Tax=Plasmodium ovale curtisi TaxID=864141 RepID=A0A1A8XB30_PLAOA|nr:PIR Superfamily Protein [Plasmodium ovale curtisi]